MLYAEKANKSLKIEESDQEAMQKQGFDIVKYSDKGEKTVILIGHGKTVPYAKYAEVVAKSEALEKEIAKLKKPSKELEKEVKE